MTQFLAIPVPSFSLTNLTGLIDWMHLQIHHPPLYYYSSSISSVVEWNVDIYSNGWREEKKKQERKEGS